MRRRTGWPRARRGPRLKSSPAGSPARQDPGLDARLESPPRRGAPRKEPAGSRYGGGPNAAGLPAPGIGSQRLVDRRASTKRRVHPILKRKRECRPFMNAGTGLKPCAALGGSLDISGMSGDACVRPGTCRNPNPGLWFYRRWHGRKLAGFLDFHWCLIGFAVSNHAFREPCIQTGIRYGNGTDGGLTH